MTILALAAVACGGEQHTTTSDAATVVKETLAAARPKWHVRIRVRLERSELPGADELKLRDAIEERLDAERVGTIIRRGAGTGWMDVEVEVDSTADAVPRIRAILESMELLEKSAIEIRQPQ